MPFSYQRIIYFRDTDAAGVVYFANVLSICHEAYEASLQSVSIDLKTFFGDRHRAIPIVHASIDFLQPMFCGERYTIELLPTLLKPSEFSIVYQIYSGISLDSTRLDTPTSNLSAVDTDEKLPGEDLTVEQTQLRETIKRTPYRKAIAKAHSRHVCIHPLDRKRLALDDAMMTWLTKYGE